MTVSYLITVSHLMTVSFACVAWGIRIHPTFALEGLVVRCDKSWDINCPVPSAYCMLGLLACSEEYEFGQLGTGLSWLR